MNMRHLTVFHAVAETGSLSKAADRLYITQPAVSRQLKALEEALGLTLVDREPRGIRLTEAGRILADYADRIFALSTRARAVMEEVRTLKSGKLSLGASNTIGNYLLPPVLARFREQHPGIEILLEIGNTDAIQRQLLEDRIDIGFTEGFAEHPEMDVSVFMHDELAIIAPPDHPLADNTGTVDLAELGRHVWVMREPGSGTQAVLEHIMQAHALRLPASFALGSTEAVKAAVLAGAGIAAVSYLTAVHEIHSGSLIHIRCSDAAFQRPLHLLRHRNRRAGPAITPFLELLMQSVNANDLTRPLSAPG